MEEPFVLEDMQVEWTFCKDKDFIGPFWIYLIVSGIFQVFTAGKKSTGRELGLHMSRQNTPPKLLNFPKSCMNDVSAMKVKVSVTS